VQHTDGVKADFLTKPWDRLRFETLRNDMGVRDY